MELNDVQLFSTYQLSGELRAIQDRIIVEELNNILDKYGDERKTEIIPFSGDLSIEDMIAEEDKILLYKLYLKIKFYYKLLNKL